MNPHIHSSESTRSARLLHGAGALSTLVYATLAIASHLQPEWRVWVWLSCMGIVWFFALAAAGIVGNLSAARPLPWILAHGLLFRAIGFFGQPIFEDDRDNGVKHGRWTFQRNISPRASSCATD